MRCMRTAKTAYSYLSNCHNHQNNRVETVINAMVSADEEQVGMRLDLFSLLRDSFDRFKRLSFTARPDNSVTERSFEYRNV